MSHTGVGNLFIVTSTLPTRKVKTRATFTGSNHRASSKRNLVTCTVGRLFMLWSSA